MSTLFTKIIQGEIPCAKLYEDERFFAFLDIRPIHKGHALLIPKREIDYLFDMPDDLMRDLLITARPIARALKKHVPCKKIGLMVAGLEVPHCHLHLVPIDDVGDLNFAKASPAEPEDLEALAEKVRQTLKMDA
ncbi:MAG: HIT family protein [Verrucomicrobia bacterium]|nr:HIT family protein [Verrucomicrobiota bacterium]MCH8512881.1 HIT family protein [Kiritimatiellia bacterium]